MRFINHVFSNGNAFPRQSYFVASDGNDSNNGTSPGSPWQTLTKINATTFVAGDHIFFRRGDTFYGSFTINQSGTATKPIVFGAYGTGSNPIITGFTSITAWTNQGSNIWESTDAVSALSSLCNMVTIGDINTPMGRYPKVTDTNKGYYTFQTSSGHTSLTSSDLTGTPNWEGAEVVIRSQAFHLKRSIVSTQVTSTITFADIGENMSNGNGFFFQNDDKCITQQNEWKFNSTTNKIKIYSTSQPSNVKIATIENLITIHANYLSFNNITFTGANGCAFYNNIFSTVYTTILVNNCIFNQIGVTPFYTNLNYLTVSNCTISDCNITAIECTYGNYNTLTNNNIQNIGLFHGMRNNKVYTVCNSCIDISIATNWTVKYNTIYNIGFNGISFWKMTTGNIENNFINTYCSVLDDGAAIYTYTSSGASSNVLISRNTCVNGIAATEGSTFSHHAHGIYLDQGTSHVTIDNNTCGILKGSGIYVTSAGYNTITNNTCYDCSENGASYLYFGHATFIPNNDSFSNNIFVAKTIGDGTFDWEKCFWVYFSGGYEATTLAGFTSDYNYFARPLDDNKVVFVSVTPPAWVKTLAEWRTYSSKDTNSNGAPQAISTVADFQFEYNETNVAKNITLAYDMLDMTGTTYTAGVRALQPYTSLVLIKKA